MNILVRKGLRKANSIRRKFAGSYLMHNRIKLLKYFEIETIFDVGANTGQFAYYSRKLGYTNRFYSFEPLKQEFEILSGFAKNDPKWEVFNMAIGDFDGEIEMNVASNSQSSSILNMTQAHIDSAPNSAYKGKQKVKIRKLDTMIPEIVDDLEATYLKIDVQGFEKNVLDGATQFLNKTKGLQLELSLVELYHGEELMIEMCARLKKMGFRLYSLEPGFYDEKSGQLLQTDGIFFKEDIL